ncbi:MAG: YhcB family protein [Thiogranum sp.]
MGDRFDHLCPGACCGAGLTYLMAGSNRRRAIELQEKLDQLQQELDDYRDQVGQHFRKTSELVQAMTDSYRNVYEHLARGSEVLCQDPVSTPRLDLPQQTRLDSAPGADTAASDNAVSEAFSDAETDSIDDELNTDALLGDTPRVPNLDSLYTEEQATHRTPSA